VRHLAAWALDGRFDTPERGDAGRIAAGRPEPIAGAPTLGRGTSNSLGEERRVVDTVTYYSGLRRNVRRYDVRATLNIPKAALGAAALERRCVEPVC
jgi:hypothetical protein